jgi:hypothetical protein
VSSQTIRAYVLVELRPGKEKAFCEEILEKGMILDSKVERTDFVHGPYDFICILNGEIKEVDQRIMDLRTSPHIRKTETLICFEVFTWEDVKSRVHKEKETGSQKKGCIK